jgi:hypothetical protein
MENLMMNSLLNIDLSELKGGFAIQDPEITNKLSNFLSQYDWSSFLKNDGKLPDIQTEYKDTFRSWIKNSKLNYIAGIDRFPHATITNGTSEAFHMFMMRHNYRNFKFLGGDFIMHKITSNIMNIDWAWIDTVHDIYHNDAVIISCPFSNTVTIHDDMSRLLEHCDSLKVPVLIDFAYFGTTSNLIQSVEYHCIEEITFSLGKTFPIIGARPGIRFQKKEIDDAVLFSNQNGIVNNFACLVGTHAMKSFSADYIAQKYETKADMIACALDARTTKSVLFVTSNDDKYAEFRRYHKHDTARFCISNILLHDIDTLDTWRTARNRERTLAPIE